MKYFLKTQGFLRPEPIEVFEGEEDLTRAAAERIADILQRTLRERNRANFVLTGGQTPKEVYDVLGDPPYSQAVQWDRVHFYWGDERCVPPDHPDSNYGMAWKLFLRKLNIPSGNMHRMYAEMANPEEAALLYETEIMKLSQGTGVPTFDLLLLGMGPDGHVASLFPGTRWDQERIVIASQNPETGAKRVSMTPRIINESKEILFLIAGLRKSKALADVLINPNSDLPATTIRPIRGNLTWMIDRAAASSIQDSIQEI